MAQKRTPLWIVVQVSSGIPVSVEAFPSRKTAELREQQIRQQINLEHDETGLFLVNAPINQE